jgi:translation initiation factor 1
MSDKQNYREVYSTDRGALCPKCSKAVNACSCKDDDRKKIVGDGNVKIRREKKGRGGKTVTTVSGLRLSHDELKKLLSELKRIIGGGGTEKDGVLELQGDHSKLILSELEKRGVKAKLAGG